jgi:bla regulator protein BlaR1
MRRDYSAIRELVLLSLVAGVALGPAAAAQTFDTVTIKPSGDTHRHHFSFDGQHLEAGNEPAYFLIEYAYGLHNSFQVVGAPEWVTWTGYNIDAKAEHAEVGLRTTPSGQVGEQPILQSLLRDRFKLSAHMERRAVPAWALVVANGGPKLKAVPANGHRKSGVEAGPVRGILEGTAATLPMLVRALPAGPVFDQTGLQGNYDFTLRWNANPAGVSIGPQYVNGVLLQGVASPVPGNSLDQDCLRGQVPGGCSVDSVVPALSKALQEQLGLELRPIQYWTDVLVIDHIEKPTAH